MKVLVLGASGMIGSTMLAVLREKPGWQVIGSVRGRQPDPAAPAPLVRGVDLANPDHLAQLFRTSRPDVVVNCAGLTKHLPEGNDPVPALTLNALLPHRLLAQCAIGGARLIHVSTDCVFSGQTGNYRESDPTDATDVYGKTKALGEVVAPYAVTLRTSTIGHENGTSLGLLEWFLAQQECRGYRHAIFSGLPSVEFARVVRDVVIPDTTLNGLYHVGAAPIDKLSLLRLIAKAYGRETSMVPDDEVHIDRSLNSEKFQKSAGYCAPSWPELIDSMYADHVSRKQKNV